MVAYLSEIKYFAHNCAFWVCHWQRGQSGKGRQSLSKPLPARGCASLGAVPAVRSKSVMSRAGREGGGRKRVASCKRKKGRKRRRELRSKKSGKWEVSRTFATNVVARWEENRSQSQHELAKEASLRVLEDLHPPQRVQMHVYRDFGLQFVCNVPTERSMCFNL